MTEEMVVAMSSADRALARLDGAALNLPNPDLFVYAFMRQEAVLSSQIEGTQASLEDVLEYEANEEGVEKTDDITEVINYLDAMDWGLGQLPELPICLRLIKGIHSRLLKDGRGSEKTPGEFRENQNWIGPAGCSIQDATYVPPAVPLMTEALKHWEEFIAQDQKLPPLIKCAYAHAQFETIHPFWDGNGRLGRMIITLLLCNQGVLLKPILYLSLFFKQNRSEYYRLLQGTRDDGNWEDWVIFFLRGVTSTSRAALKTTNSITQLRESLLRSTQVDMSSKKAPALAEILFKNPYLTISKVRKLLDVSYPTASSIVEQFESTGFLQKVKGDQRDRVFGFKPYLDILHEGAGDLTGVISGEDYLITNSNV